ncbi:MAG: DNA-3-methyladenine glycosylase family protein [Eubacteriales bacterium]
MSKFEFEVCDFDLRQIFECGQCFRWEAQKDGSYLGIVSSVAAKLSLEKSGKYSGKLTIDTQGAVSEKEFWEDYLDLLRDYTEIKRELSQSDEKISVAISFGEGIRILKQDVFETIISFIISQNSNIPRIKKCINAICEKFGKQIVSESGEIFYAFPSVEEMAKAGVEDLKALKLGYRAEYIASATDQIYQNMEEFSKLKIMEYGQAREFLLKLKGVGPKVADCILLFALGKFEAFPIDVWVKRVMHEIYGFDEKDLRSMSRYAKEKFKDKGGIAQQYLFYYMRSMGS